MSPTDGCEPTTPYFVDGDGDKHGAKGTPKAGEACSIPPGFAAVADDCKDDNPLVVPGQMQYFDNPYPTATGPSFDYNCNAVEEVQGGTPTGSCSPICFPGYLKLDGSANLCGSTTYISICRHGLCDNVVTRPAVKCR
jgi:hypothetical protein